MFEKASLGICVAAVVFTSLGSRYGLGTERDTDAFWPQWRGPNRDAVATDVHLLQQWPEGGPPLIWTGQGLGTGYASVVIADGRIFTMGDRDDGAYLICLDDDDGSEIWATRVGDTWEDDGPRSTPTIGGDVVYGLTPHGDLVCLAVADGAIRWRKQMKADFGGRMMSDWGYSESPLVDEDRLICTPGSDRAALAALDRRTGETIWLSEIAECGGAAYASIVKTHAGGVPQYVTLLGETGGVVGVRATDGMLLWQHTGVAGGTANIPTPIVREDLVFYTTGYDDGGSALLKIVPDGDGLSVEEVYTKSAGDLRNHHGGVVRVGDYLFGGHGKNNGFPFCLRFETGKETWRRGRGPGDGSAAVVYADGRLYFRYENGVMALIKADPEGYHLVSSFEIPEGSEPSWAHPVIAGGRLFLRDEDRLLCFDLRAKSLSRSPPRQP